MKKKVFFVVFVLIILATLRFYYIGFQRGFDNLPVITSKENTANIVTELE